ncbi:cysteine hydrolase family protein [Nocardia callitridis]|uniref:Isochorismatase-like domain-containing protein n=1 Tax=Nocardia callitridis TaxID=648753 RepID=A0ABP9JW43_9NOCA
MSIQRTGAAVLALHWQVNVIRPEGFFGPMLAAPVAASGVVERASALHEAMRARGIPLLFTRFTVPVGEGQLVRNTAFMRAVADAQTEFRPDAPGAAIIPEMAHQPTEVFDNQKLSGLAGNAAVRWLTEHGVDTLYLTGVATNLTVAQTARHATDLGFTVHPVIDCVTAADPGAHEAAIADLELVTSSCVAAARVLESVEHC